MVLFDPTLMSPVIVPFTQITAALVPAAALLSCESVATVVGAVVRRPSWSSLHHPKPRPSRSARCLLAARSSCRRSRRSPHSLRCHPRHLLCSRQRPRRPRCRDCPSPPSSHRSSRQPCPPWLHRPSLRLPFPYRIHRYQQFRLLCSSCQCHLGPHQRRCPTRKRSTRRRG